MVIVDAYNLLHAALGPAGGGRDFGVAGLARMIAASRYSGRPVRLVCDGRPKPGDTGDDRVPGVQVTYSGPGRDADGVIERLIKDSTDPRRLTVVSSDRRIVRAARKRRAESVPSERFLAHLLADGARRRTAPEDAGPRDEVPLGPASVADWIEYFGPEALTIRADSWARATDATPARPKNGPVRRNGPPTAAPAPPTSDPVLREAVEHFRGRVSWDELDMDRWLAARTVRGRAGNAGGMDAPRSGL